MSDESNAAQRDASRRPLGTGQQGRFPQAEPEPEQPDDDEGFGPIEGMLSLPMFISAASVIFLVAVMLWPWLSDLARWIGKWL